MEMSKIMVEREREDGTGRFSTEYQDESFIKAISELDGSASTKEIADFVNCDRRTAYLRLTELEKSGKIDSHKVGNSILWIGD